MFKSSISRLLFRILAICSSLVVAWWGAWQLTWVQTGAARLLTSVLADRGLECRVGAITLNGWGRWELRDLEARWERRLLSAEQVEIGVTPWGLLHWARGQGSISHLEVLGLSLDGKRVAALDGVALECWAAPTGKGWTAQIQAPGGWRARGHLNRKESAGWHADVEFVGGHPSFMDWIRWRGPPIQGRMELDVTPTGWSVTGTGTVAHLDIGPSDHLEASMEWSAQGTGADWTARLGAHGSWDHEGESSDISLESSLSGGPESWRVENATCLLPFAKMEGRFQLGEISTGACRIEAQDLAQLIPLSPQWLMPYVTALQGGLEADLDWQESDEGYLVGVQATWSRSQLFGLQAEQVKMSARSLLRQGNWSDLVWNAQGSCQATNLLNRMVKIDQLNLGWQPGQRGLQGSLSAAGLCGGRMQLTADWRLDSQAWMVDALSGTLFGQPLCAPHPLRIEALGSSWVQSEGLRLKELDISWGSGHLTGSAEICQQQWKGRFQAQRAPLDWVGLLITPLPCTGFGDLQLTLGGHASRPVWHAELNSEEATAVLGLLHGDCRAALTLDGSEQSLSIQGRVGIRKAQVGLGHLEVNPGPAFDVLWAGQGLQNRAGRAFNVFYDIDLQAEPGARCIAGPVETAWDGALRLRGSNAEPKLEGVLHLQPGEVELAGCPFSLLGGTLHVKGIDPDAVTLDLQAQTPLCQGSARFSCTGSASQPCLSIDSDCGLSTVELLKQLGEIAHLHGGTEMARRLEQAVQWLPKADPDAIQRLRKETGLDRIELTSAEPDHESLQLILGNQLAERLLVQLHQRLGADVSGFSIESGESFSTVQGRSYALQSGTGLLPPGRFALRWKVHY